MLKSSFTSTGEKFFAHQQVMQDLRDGRGRPIVTHIMLTDVCNHSCAFCSVQYRAGDSLPFDDVVAYLDILQSRGLKAVILSGGGNPILYRNGGKDFNDVVDHIHGRGLEIGLITNGMPLRRYGHRTDCDQLVGTWVDAPNGVRTLYEDVYCKGCGCWYSNCVCRKSWKTVAPTTLDKCTWIRISMSGLDHEEREVFTPDVGPNTTLGYSYVGHDIYIDAADTHHGGVSRKVDLISGDLERAPDWTFEERIPELREQIIDYVIRHNPAYVRLLPNCLEVDLIARRCDQMQFMAADINAVAGREVAFVQYKPPAAPKACYLGYVHPVLNCDGFIYPCDSCVLNEEAKHTFNERWRVCHWSEVGRIYDEPVRSLIGDPAAMCPGCVFTASNELLGNVVAGAATPAPANLPIHHNFV